jgi:hypothetical protein
VQEDGDETAKDNSKAEKGDSGTGSDMSSRKPGMDHFNNEESNPIKSNAMSKYLLESFSIPLKCWPIITRSQLPSNCGNGIIEQVYPSPHSACTSIIVACSYDVSGNS